MNKIGKLNESSTPASKAEKSGAVTDYRLPRSLKPYYYDLQIKPYFNVTSMPSRYDGHVTIRFTCLEDTSKLVMHINNLRVDNDSIEVALINDSSFDAQNNGTAAKNDTGHVERLKIWKRLTWFLDPKRQFFIVQFGKRIFKKGQNYMVDVSFTGVLKDDNSGLYASSYIDANGNRR